MHMNCFVIYLFLNREVFKPADIIFSLPSIDDVAIKSISIETFTLEYIEAATEKYKTLIGEGGFGSVYRGTLPDGQEVAVKVRSATSTQGTREFENEVGTVSKVALSIITCCSFVQQFSCYHLNVIKPFSAMKDAFTSCTIMMDHYHQFSV